VNKPKSSPAALLILIATSLSLSACEAPPKKHNSEDAAKTTGSATTTGADTGTTTSATSTTSATTSTDAAPTAESTNVTPPQPAAQQAAQPQGKSELDDLPQLNAVRAVNLSKLKDSLIICTVNGSAITVETFKKEFREAVVSLQSMLTSQPQKVNQLLNDSKAMGVELTPDEKNRLLQTARQKEALQGKSFTDFIKEKKITEAQFNEQVLMLGLAFKTGTKVIESQLLSEIINRDLVLQGARNSGFQAIAMNHFIEFKHSQKYNDLLKSSNATAEQIKQEIIDHEMLVLEMDKIAKSATLPDAALRDAYDKNKANFKHGDRLKISHIVIAAPLVDNPPLESIRSQIKKQKPNLTKDELDKEEQVLKVHQQNLATEILTRAKNGEDFKALADRYTDDVQARVAKAGGDLGYVDLSLKMPAVNGQKSDQEKLTDAVKNLKVGQVAPDLVQTNFGYHIVKLTGKQPAGLLTFEEVKPTLKELIGNKAKELAEVNWIAEQRKKATIKVSDELQHEAERQKAEAAKGAPPAAQK
jgi:peptidyl-prolyl cis-trans isomerase C